MKGRRLPVVDGKPTDPAKPGDYCGPVLGGGRVMVLFLKPNAHDPGAHPRAQNVQHVCSPLHTFIEEEDGTLTIRPSISDTVQGGSDPDGWHGWLEHGEWRQV